MGLFIGVIVFICEMSEYCFFVRKEVIYMYDMWCFVVY